MSSKIAGYALRFLQWFCPSHLHEEIEGDLIQKYHREIKKLGEKKATRRLVWNILRFFRPGIILRNRFSTGLNFIDMLSNYWKIMVRNLMKHKVYSSINVFGLTIGITFAVMIGVFCWGELQVNKQLKDVDRLYIIERDLKDTSGMGFFAPTPIGRALKEQYPTLVENYFRFYDRNIKVSKEDKHFVIQGIIGDSTLLTMFGMPVLYGDAKTALREHHSVVITEKMAKQFFNRADVVGETLTLTNGFREKKEVVITAVLEDLQRNSVTDLVDINAQYIIPLQDASDFMFGDPKDFEADFIITYLKLAPKAQPGDVQRAMINWVKNNGSPQQKRIANLNLRGLKDYYLITQNGAAQKMIWILSGIAYFILLLAIINFINISIASATVRLKEIGVRKVIGGVRKQIIFQFLSESLIITSLAGLLAIGCYELLRPAFESLLNVSLPAFWKLNISFWKWFVITLFFVGVSAGAYPAFFMSSYHIIESLKGKLKSAKEGLMFSKGLMTVQFLVAIFIFCCSIVITRQVSYFLEKDLGYDKSFVLTVFSVPRIWTDEGIKQMNSAKHDFLTSSHVESVSLSWEIPNGNNGDDVSLYRYGSDEDKSILMPLLKSDEDFDNVYKIKINEGEFFSEQDGSWKPNRIVINDATSKLLNLHVGDQARMRGTDSIFTVAGVVADFNFFSLRDPVKPVVIMHTKDLHVYRFFSFRLKPGNLSASVEDVEKHWKKLFPEDPFDYAFMDDRLASLYKSEQQLKKASALATGVMLMIVLIGVLGLVALNVAKRTKEIGVRKVLGASMLSIMTLFSKEYIRMILIAFALAVPSALYFVDSWLSGFAYRVTLQWWMFILPGLGLLLVALGVVIIQSYKAASVNPVKSLRRE
jgi:putative ABC transport system permease protein